MDFKNMNNNIISKKWQDRYANLPEEVMKRVDILKNSVPKDYMLKKKKREKEYPDIGTIFELLTVDDITIFGMVANNHITSVLGDDLLTVYIFNPNYSPVDSKDDNLIEKFLIPPQIISSELWNKGYAQNVGKISIELSEDICFYDAIFNVFFDEYGKQCVQRTVIGTYALTTIFGLSKQIQRELIINGVV